MRGAVDDVLRGRVQDPVLDDVEHSRLEWYAPGRTGTLLLPRGSLYSSHPVFNIGGQGGLDAALLLVVAVVGRAECPRWRRVEESL